MNRAVGIIPARLQSTRFPAKPLALLCGRPMIQHTYEAACKATSLSHVYVATDSEVIAAAVDAPSSTLLTSEACENGTARVLDALRQLDHDAALSYDIVVNIQGDEPLVDPMHIDMCVAANALYFSRGMIPSSKDDAFEPRRCMKHIGLYAFRRSFLVDVFPQLKSLHTSEDLEQLRVLEAGYKIKMVTVPFAYPGVDLPSDVAKVERLMTR
ncbi:hypothetical protein DYB32_005315 [Aphanomyces invadans]|uniref:3-deoxy-D-manno-octulosonate cytidylyltransferase n=1 Tax=Aphanomyces invadans TaxID=157072 RepID=A0A418AUW1_9STRA|nr:hypothetical protein DYB32_005315 [Aphanomyces invadans]